MELPDKTNVQSQAQSPSVSLTGIWRRRRSPLGGLAGDQWQSSTPVEFWLETGVKDGTPLEATSVGRNPLEVWLEVGGETGCVPGDQENVCPFYRKTHPYLLYIPAKKHVDPSLMKRTIILCREILSILAQMFISCALDLCWAVWESSLGSKDKKGANDNEEVGWVKLSWLHVLFINSCFS